MTSLKNCFVLSEEAMFHQIGVIIEHHINQYQSRHISCFVKKEFDSTRLDLGTESFNKNRGAQVRPNFNHLAGGQ